MTNTFNELLQKIEELKLQAFEIKTLRQALILYNKIGINHNKEEEQKLKQIIDKIMKLKFLELNQNFSEDVLKKLCLTYKRGYICIPADLTILNDDIVFYKEKILNDWGEVYKSNVLFLSTHKENDFKEIDDKNLDFTQNHWDEKFEFNKLFSKIDYLDYFDDNEKLEKLIRQIVAHINNALNTIFKQDVIAPIADLNKNGVFYGIDGIYYKTSTRIFLSHNLNQIMKSIYEHQNTTIKLITLNNWNEFYCFDIYQTVFQDKSFEWKAIQTNHTIWNLEENLKNKKDKKLTKKDY